MIWDVNLWRGPTDQNKDGVNVELTCQLEPRDDLIGDLALCKSVVAGGGLQSS